MCDLPLASHEPTDLEICLDKMRRHINQAITHLEQIENPLYARIAVREAEDILEVLRDAQ